MTSLAELENFVTQALMQNEQGRAASSILANRLGAKHRLQIYRNNIYINLGGVLAAVFPVVHKLVGNDCFKALGRQYISRHQSRAGHLQDYGQGFADFLEDFASSQGLPYLPDVARLEWACDEAFHAAESVTLDRHLLANVKVQDYSRICFELHPAVRLIHSPYPVFRIWQVNQPDYTGDGTVDLTEGGDELLITRRDLHVFIERLDAKESVLLHRLKAGDCLLDACQQLLQAGYSADVDATISSRIYDATLVGFHLATTSGD